MSDGPFKNLKLGKRWKQFAEAVQNDTYDRTMCCAMASHALVDEILSDNVKHLLTEIQNLNSQLQLILDPLTTVVSIFNKYIKEPFVDTLQKEMVFRLSGMIPLSDAITQAVGVTVNEHTRVANNRIVEECILARETGKMRQDQFDKATRQSRAIFESLDQSEVCEAVLSGNKNAFKHAVSKKIGLDEGPIL